MISPAFHNGPFIFPFLYDGHVVECFSQCLLHPSQAFPCPNKIATGLPLTTQYRAPPSSLLCIWFLCENTGNGTPQSKTNSWVLPGPSQNSFVPYHRERPLSSHWTSFPIYSMGFSKSELLFSLNMALCLNLIPLLYFSNRSPNVWNL